MTPATSGVCRRVLLKATLVTIHYYLHHFLYQTINLDYSEISVQEIREGLTGSTGKVKRYSGREETRRGESRERLEGGK